LRGLLELAGYYRRFVKDYGVITKPLTGMLSRDNFTWTDTIVQAFDKLKSLMSSTPVLALPNFSQDFVIEVDVSDYGIGAVLMQENHPIAYISKAFNKQRHSYSTYENELLGVDFVVQRWRHYLLNKHFIIKTDYYSLKYILTRGRQLIFNKSD